MSDDVSKEPAYTPRAEFDCDGNTTHYQGCKCHEARRNARLKEVCEFGGAFRRKLAETEARNFELIEALKMCSTRASIADPVEACRMVIETVRDVLYPARSKKGGTK